MEKGALVEELRVALRAAGTEERARGAKAYLKSELEFYGVPAGPLRDLVRRFLGDHPELVADFVSTHRDRMSALTFREATRKLPEALRRDVSSSGSK